MDTIKKVSFNSTMITQYTTLTIQDDNKTVKDIQNKINQILKGKTSKCHDYSTQLKCRVPLTQTFDCQKLCQRVSTFNQKYQNNDANLAKINERVLNSYRFTSVSAKRRLTKSQHQSPQVQVKGHWHHVKKNKIFNTEWQEYQNIYDLHTLLSPNSLDMRQAYEEVEFIKSKIKQPERVVIQQEEKTYSSYNDEVYSVQPNKMVTRRIVLKPNNQQIFH